MRKNQDLPLAVDAMGGDHGPSVIVEGAVRSFREDGHQVILVGDETTITTELKKHGIDNEPGLLVRHAPEVIEMHEKPAQAVRKKRGSSMRLACELAKTGDAYGAFSVGNSGAMMAAALLVYGRIRGVIRPCIATVFPSARGVGVLTDAGANTECTPEQLLQFGIMGAAYLLSAFEATSPKVGVIANGTEAQKGTELSRGALALLAETDLNFVGHIEPGMLVRGEVSVGVTDGFTGNIMLKTGEATSSYMSAAIKDAIMNGGPIAKVAGLMLRGTLTKMASKLDPREFGAAPLLGLKYSAFIGHGSSDAYSVQTAIRRARVHATHNVTDAIRADIERWVGLAQKREDVAS